MKENGVYDWSRHEGPTEPVRLPVTTLKLDDETLRDGLQGAQLEEEQAISINDKKIYIELAAPFVDHFDLAYPNSHETQVKDALELIRHGIAKGLKTSYSLAGRAAKCEDIKPIIGIFEEVEHYPLRADIFLDGSTQRARFQGWDRNEMLEQMESNIRTLKKHGMRVMFVAERATATHPNELEETLTMAADSGADVLCIADTQGLADTKAMTNIARWTLKNIGTKYQEIEWDAHCHNHLGMAVANSLVAIQEGFSEIHGTVLWLGEGPGNADNANLLTALVVKGYLDRDLRELTKFYKEVSDLIRLKIPVSAPVVGNSAHKTSSGIHAQAIEKGEKTEDASLIYFPYHPELVGAKASAEVGPMSSLANVRLKLKDMGIVGTEEMMAEILEEAKNTGRILPESRIRRVAERFSA